MEKHLEVINRLKRVLEIFLDPNFVATNSVYFEKLLTHLGAKENAYVLQAPFAMDWVDQCLKILNEDFNKINPKVTSFMFNFCSILSSNEWIVIQIRERKIMDRVLTIVKRDVLKFNPSIKLGTIRLMAAVSRYSLGLAYIRKTKAWHFLIKYCNKDHTLYVIREARALLYELLYKFSVKTSDEQCVVEILGEIVKPILDNNYDEKMGTITITVDDNEMQHKLSATFELISYIFQQTLEAEEKTNLVNLCEKHFNLEFSMWKLIEYTQNSFYLEKLLTALVSRNFAELLYENWQLGQIVGENFNKFGITFYNIMKFCISRSECFTFLKMTELNLILWKKLGKRAPAVIQIENETVLFENQLIVFHLMPLLFLLKSKCWKKVEIFDNYIMKLFEISCEQTLRICYSYRDLLHLNESYNTRLVVDLAYKSIHGVLSMENILEREQAVLVFQAMIYALKEFVLTSNHESESFALHCMTDKDEEQSENSLNPIPLVEISNVLYASLIGMQRLIKRYKITWKESIETICLVNFIAMILENPNLETRIVVQALKLVQLAIEHFLAPNMALLVDNLQGSGLVCLGPIIAKRFHDPNWEVRDSALEFAASIANISQLKFPAFQQFLADYEICPIVFKMAVHDHEPYVRASAFKCLSEMIPINIIWESDLSKENLVEYLLCILYNETEGVVRKEAIMTLSRIYEKRKIPAHLHDKFYSILSHCVVNDLYWEVKVRALGFWELEFEKLFTNQGMIDGTFPTVTFSKEYKKIVTLNEKEITLRITKVFNELSHKGCLGVILKCLKEEYDLEVIKAAIGLIQRLCDKVKKYDYDAGVEDMDYSITPTTPIKLPNIGSTKMIVNEESTETGSFNTNHEENLLSESSKNIPNADEIIESILDSQDINLLAATYTQQMQISNGNENRPRRPQIHDKYYQQYTSVTGKDFIKSIKQMDLVKLLENQEEWILCPESFISLLDDICISVKPPDEAIDADCY